MDETFWEEVGTALTEFGGDVAGAISDALSDAFKAFSGEALSFESGGNEIADTGKNITKELTKYDDAKSVDPQDFIGIGSDPDLGAGFMQGLQSDQGKSMLAKFREWYGTLDKSEKELFKGVAGAGLAGLAGMASAKLKSSGDIELANAMSRNRQAELDHKLAATATPRGVPFQPSKKPLTNKLGQPVALPENPMKPRGLIYGGMYG